MQMLDALVAAGWWEATLAAYTAKQDAALCANSLEQAALLSHCSHCLINYLYYLLLLLLILITTTTTITTATSTNYLPSINQ